MSWRISKNVWGPEFPAEAEGIGGPVVRLVALAIADMIDYSTHEFFGALTTVAEMTGLNRDTVRRVVTHLVDVGVLDEMEKRSGRPTKYRWTWGGDVGPRGQAAGSPAAPRGETAGYPAAQAAGTPRPRPRRTRGERDGELDLVVNDESTSATTTPDEPTPGQIAKRMIDRYWSWCRERYGRAPDVSAPGLMQIVIALLKDGVDEAAIRGAIKVLHENGRPITKATIGAEIDGRRPARVGRQDVVAINSSMQFDAHGNLVGSVGR